MATPVRRLFLWKKLNAVNLAKLGSNCNLQPEEKRQLQKSGHWLLWDKSTVVNIPAWLEGLRSHRRIWRFIFQSF